MNLKKSILQKIKDWLRKQFGVDGGTSKPPQDNPDTTPAVTPSDALPWNTIHWEGQNKAVNAEQTKILRSVTIYGDMDVRLDYDTNTDWSAPCKADVSDCHSSFMVFTTAIDGALRGGHIDHMRSNAKQRDLGNLYNGYMFPAVPRNADLYIAIASNDGKYRSNMVKAIRK